MLAAHPGTVLADATNVCVARQFGTGYLQTMVRRLKRAADVHPRMDVKFVAFRGSVGTIKTRPESWKDLFFTDIHDLPGS